MSEVLLEAPNPLRMWLADIEATEANSTEANWATVQTVIDDTTAKVVAELQQGLLRMGYDHRSAPSRCLFLQMQAYERRGRPAPEPQGGSSEVSTP
jgi:hypothetical protein